MVLRYLAARCIIIIITTVLGYVVWYNMRMSEVKEYHHEMYRRKRVEDTTLAEAKAVTWRTEDGIASLIEPYHQTPHTCK